MTTTGDKVSLREAGRLLGVAPDRARNAPFWTDRGVGAYREGSRVFLNRSDVQELIRVRSGRRRVTDTYRLARGLGR